MRPYLVLLLFTACTVSDDDEARCTDPKYGDGTCDVELACDAPDIDCFVTFDDQPSAQRWYTSSPLEASEPALPATDAHYGPMKALLDRGWAAYQKSHAVGDLAQHEVQLVIVQPPKLNLGAFAMANPERTQEALLVGVETELLDLHAPDEQVIAVVMHELQHAIGLHSVGDVAERLRKVYVAPPGSEPFGSDQSDDATTRQRLDAWLVLADDVGYLADVELHGLPIGGALAKAFDATNAARLQADPTNCQAPLSALNNVYAAVDARKSPLDGSVDLSGTNAETVIVKVLTDLQTTCYAAVTADAVAVVAQVLHVDAAMLRASLPADLQAMLAGKSYLPGLTAWIAYDRAKLRGLEGSDWSRVRYFSTEEAADDSSVVTLHAMGLPADSIGRFLPTLTPGLEPLCRPLVDGMQPIPYGENLSDKHHATCWRAGHAAARAAALDGRRASNRLDLSPPRTRSLLAHALEHD